MKTERRHELQTNELAAWLADWVKTITPYTKLILGGLILLLTAWIAWSFIQNRAQQAREEAWSRLFQVYEGADISADQLMTVEESYRGSEAGLWALQTAADLRLAEGTQQLFVDRTQAVENLEEAEKTYRTVTEQAQDPLLKQRAMFGLAQAMESRNNFEEAKEQYQQVVKDWPDAAVARLAERRLENLRQPVTQEWYAWFAEQKPIASPLADPSLFEDLPNLPEAPNLPLPGPGQMVTPSGTLPTDEQTPGGSLPLDLDAEQPILPLELDGPGTTTTGDAPADTNPLDLPESATDEAPGESESEAEAPTPPESTEPSVP